MIFLVHYDKNIIMHSLLFVEFTNKNVININCFNFCDSTDLLGHPVSKTYKFISFYCFIIYSDIRDFEFRGSSRPIREHPSG